MFNRVHFAFGHLLPGKKGVSHAWFLGYAALFLAFSLNLLPANIAMGMLSLIFLTAPMEVIPYLYFFSLPWMYVAKFDFGLTLSLVQSVVYLVKVLIARLALKFSLLEFFVLLYLVGIGLFGFLNTGSTTGISFVIYFLIACQVRHLYFKSADTRCVFLRTMLFSITISVCIATIYGFANGTSHLRHIAGLGYSNQMSGTLGTTRFAMYLCLALLYPLYCVENRKWKFALAGLLSTGVIATISLSSFAVLGIVWAYYFVAKGGKIKTLLLISLGAVVLEMGGTLLWNRISTIPLFRPLAMRVEFSLDKWKVGDLDSATSGRSILLDSYLGEYANADLSTQLFGKYSVKMEGMNFSHNSYIDMLNCLGLSGLVLILALQLKRIRDNLRYPERDLLLSMKIIVLLTAATVSIFSAQYWQMFLYF